LEALQAFQTKVLCHAMELPDVVRISYSTCSVHEAENEDVVARALASPQGAGFRLVPALPRWSRRGRATDALPEPLARACLRCDPDLDRTSGFFVALFERALLRKRPRTPGAAEQLEEVAEGREDGEGEGEGEGEEEQGTGSTVRRGVQDARGGEGAGAEENRAAKRRRRRNLQRQRQRSRRESKGE
jgi:hypothetical protein